MLLLVLAGFIVILLIRCPISTVETSVWKTRVDQGDLKVFPTKNFLFFREFSSIWPKFAKNWNLLFLVIMLLCLSTKHFPTTIPYFAAKRTVVIRNIWIFGFFTCFSFIFFPRVRCFENSARWNWKCDTFYSKPSAVKARKLCPRSKVRWGAVAPRLSGWRESISTTLSPLLGGRVLPKK